jgi:Protein N-terminal asparagine amidohydrolase
MFCQVIGPGPLLYVSVREFAVTHPHDNKISVLGTDDVTTNLVLLVRHSGSGAVGLTQVLFSTFFDIFYYVLCTISRRTPLISFL